MLLDRFANKKNGGRGFSEKRRHPCRHSGLGMAPVPPCRRGLGMAPVPPCRRGRRPAPRCRTPRAWIRAPRRPAFSLSPLHSLSRTLTLEGAPSRRQVRLRPPHRAVDSGRPEPSRRRHRLRRPRLCLPADSRVLERRRSRESDPTSPPPATVFEHRRLTVRPPPVSPPAPLSSW